MKHSKFDYVKRVVEANIPCLIQGPAGTSKSTTAMQVVEALDLKMHSITCTRQTSVNNFLGFLSVTGVYITSQLRQAFEFGGAFVIEEINACDANTLICLNTIENGFLSFPDKIVHRHKDFRLLATANPNDNVYSARTNLDFATDDRLLKINFEPDAKLELALTSQETVDKMKTVRHFLSSQGSSIQATMRDAIRIEKLTKLGLVKEPILEVIFTSDESLGNMYKLELAEITTKLQEQKVQEEKDKLTQHDMQTFDEFYEKVAKNQ